VLLAPAQRPRGRLGPPTLVRGQQPLCQPHEGGEVRHLADRPPRAHPAQEKRLALVEVADAGEVALVEQGVGDLPVGSLPQAADGFIGVPAGAEQVGAEMVDERALPVGRHEVKFVQVIADGDGLRRVQHHPDQVGRPAARALVGTVHAPCAVHAQV
jgi:hypothetical protein